MLDSIPVVYRASARRRHKRRVLRHAPLEPWETRGVSTRWAPLGGPTVTCPEVVLLLDLPWGKKRARSVEALMLPDQRALAEMLFYIDIEVRGTEGGDTNASSLSKSAWNPVSPLPEHKGQPPGDIAPSLPLN